jgi:3-oxoacyl-[acyl-carrier-protein] synthase II
VGPVSAIGIGREAFFAGLREARSGITEITSFDTTKYKSKQAAGISHFDVKDYLESEKTYLDRSSEFAFAGMSLALEDADLDVKKLDSSETALLLGSAFGNLITAGVFFDDFLKKGPRLVKPILFPHTYSNTTISLLAIEYGLSGYHVSFASGAVSASCAILEGYDLIRLGRAKIALAGGFESLGEILFSGFHHQGWISPQGNARETCAPFDRSRNGFILGEGCGILVLEELESAQARGATIYGEIMGAGMVSDSSINQEGGGAWIVEAMKRALKDLPFDEQNLDYISASANGSPFMDRNEGKAIATLLDTHTDDIPVSSIKPMLGETLGASGALQMIAALATFEDAVIPPTLNLEKPDDEIALQLVRGNGRKGDVHRALLNTLDPGGSMVSFAIQGLK